MSGPKLDKKQRKRLRDIRRKRQNKRSARAGEYGRGKASDRKNQENYYSWEV